MAYVYGVNLTHFISFFGLSFVLVSGVEPERGPSRDHGVVPVSVCEQATSRCGPEIENQLRLGPLPSTRRGCASAQRMLGPPEVRAGAYLELTQPMLSTGLRRVTLLENTGHTPAIPQSFTDALLTAASNPQADPELLAVLAGDTRAEVCQAAGTNPALVDYLATSNPANSDN